MDERFDCRLLTEENNEDESVNFEKFFATEYYDFEYFKNKFPLFQDTIIDILVELSNKKVIIDDSKTVRKENKISLNIKKEETTLLFD